MGIQVRLDYTFEAFCMLHSQCGAQILLSPPHSDIGLYASYATPIAPVNPLHHLAASSLPHSYAAEKTYGFFYNLRPFELCSAAYITGASRYSKYLWSIYATTLGCDELSPSNCKGSYRTSKGTRSDAYRRT